MAKQNEWLVYFYENRDYHRHTKFFKKGFKHCGVMGYDAEKKIWIISEYLFGKLNIEILNEDEVDKISKFPVIMGSWIKEHSCVSYVQRLIGWSRFWIFTPNQLYCALKKNGMCEIEL